MSHGHTVVSLGFGKTPMQTFLDGLPLAKEKMLNQTVQTVTDIA